MKGLHFLAKACLIDRTYSESSCSIRVSRVEVLAACCSLSLVTPPAEPTSCLFRESSRTAHSKGAQLHSRNRRARCPKFGSH